MSSPAAAVADVNGKNRRRRGINDDTNGDDGADSSGTKGASSRVAGDGSTTADAGAESSSPNGSVSIPIQPEQHLILALQRLDDEYSRLSSKEQQIQQYLDTLQQEEIALRHALELTSTSLKEQRVSEKKRKEEEALLRLEEALMMDDVDSSEDEDGS